MNPFTRSIDHPDPASNFDPPTYHAMGADKSAITTGDLNGFTLSRSELRSFGKNPSKWIRKSGRDETRAMRYGSLLDAMLLAPDHFESRFTRRPDTYPAEGKKGEPATDKPWNGNSTWCKEWMESSFRRGLTPFKTDEESAALAAISRLSGDDNIARVLMGSRKSVFALVNYLDRATGLNVPIKIMVDLVPDCDPERGSLGDLKTTSDASGEVWQRHVFSMGYHYQAAMYLDAWNACTGEDRQGWFHVVSESSAPFEPAQRALSTEFIELGRNEYQRDLALFCECVDAGKWPGYDGETHSRLILTGGWHLVEPMPWMAANAYASGFKLPSAVVSKPTSEESDEVMP